MYINGRFPLKKISVDIWKRGQPLKCTEVFIYVLSGIPVPFDFLPEFSVEWFSFWKFNNFQVFWKLSQEISLLIAPVSKISEFLVEKK